jgi:hypothetical protein
LTHAKSDGNGKPIEDGNGINEGPKEEEEEVKMLNEGGGGREEEEEKQ